MRESHPLRLMFDGLSVHDSSFKLFDNGTMNSVTLDNAVVSIKSCAQTGFGPTKSSTVHLVERSTTGAE